MACRAIGDELNIRLLSAYYAYFAEFFLTLDGDPDVQVGIRTDGVRVGG